jgi:Tfp pilus assembly protein PilW
VKRTRGLTMAETLVGLSLTSLMFMMSLSFFTSSIGSLRKSDVRVQMSQKLNLALRKISQEVRGAATITISPDSKTLTFQLPKLNVATDPVTGEKEYTNPIQGDGVNRSFYVSGSNLYYNDGATAAKIIARDVSATDPDPQSSYYNQSYPVFTFSSVGSTKGMTIMLIGKKLVRSNEYVRLSTSIRFRNMP